MYTLRSFERPTTQEEALRVLGQGSNHVILGGTHWLRLSTRAYDTGIDLSLLPNFTTITKDETSSLLVGAGVSYGQLEDHEWVTSWLAGVFSRTLKGIVSRQMRNTATIGGSLYSRFAFSDTLPVLLAADAEVQLARAGWMKIDELLSASPKDLKGDFLYTLKLPACEGVGSYQAIRITAQDFPMVNVAVVAKRTDKGSSWSVTSGARPGVACRCQRTSALLDEFIPCDAFIDQHLSGKTPEIVLTPDNMKALAEALAQDAEYKSGGHASAAYRNQAAGSLLKKALNELGGGLVFNAR